MIVQQPLDSFEVLSQADVTGSALNFADLLFSSIHFYPSPTLHLD